MTPLRLSALIVVHNEEKNLPACLASCAFADEILVVLDRCSDGSRDVAAAAGARCLEGAWPNEGDRRNAGIDACAGPWIIELDADERITPALAEEIQSFLPGAKPGCVLIPFDNYIGARLVKHGWGAYNGVAAKWCLFEKSCKRWENHSVHPGVALTGARARLAAPICHYVDASLSDTFARLNRYSDAAARDAVAAGKIGSGWGAFRRIFSRFYKSYVARAGYREGFYGIALGAFAALYPLLTYLKAREIAAARERAAE